MNEDPDPWEERLQFSQLFLLHLAGLGQPLLPSGLTPLGVAGYLEMIGLGEMLAECDRTGAARPGWYRDAAYLHGALDTGATWEQVAEATGDDEATTRRRYREWAEDQHREWARSRYEGLNDNEYTTAIGRAKGGG